MEECGGWWEVARRLVSPQIVDVSPFCSIIGMAPFFGVCCRDRWCGDGVGMGRGEVGDEGGCGEGGEDPRLANALRGDGGMQSLPLSNSLSRRPEISS